MLLPEATGVGLMGPPNGFLENQSLSPESPSCCLSGGVTSPSYTHSTTIMSLVMRWSPEPGGALSKVPGCEPNKALFFIELLSLGYMALVIGVCGAPGQSHGLLTADSCSCSNHYRNHRKPWLNKAEKWQAQGTVGNILTSIHRQTGKPDCECLAALGVFWGGDWSVGWGVGYSPPPGLTALP